MRLRWTPVERHRDGLGCGAELVDERGISHARVWGYMTTEWKWEYHATSRLTDNPLSGYANDLHSACVGATLRARHVVPDVDDVTYMDTLALLRIEGVRFVGAAVSP